MIYLLNFLLLAATVTPVNAAPLKISSATQSAIFALSPVLGISAFPFLSVSEVAFEGSFPLEAPFSPEPEFSSFFGSSGVLSFFGTTVSLFSISFVECASLKYLLQSAQYQYSVLPSASSVASFASTCLRLTWLEESISL